MADPAPPASPPSARDRLLDAALELVIERGVRGATTRAIAERAAVNEVTLFRTFGSKGELIAAAFERVADAFAGTALGGPDASDDVAADLERLAATYSGFVNARRTALARLLTDPALNEQVAPVLRRVANRVVALFRHHQARGHLRSGDPEASALAFVGPLLARALAGRTLGIEPELEPRAYVRRYLEGYGS